MVQPHVPTVTTIVFLSLEPGLEEETSRQQQGPGETQRMSRDQPSLSEPLWGVFSVTVKTTWTGSSREVVLSWFF